MQKMCLKVIARRSKRRRPSRVVIGLITLIVYVDAKPQNSSIYPSIFSPYSIRRLIPNETNNRS